MGMAAKERKEHKENNAPESGLPNHVPNSVNANQNNRRKSDSSLCDPCVLCG
jgi:hypothetical protein